MKELEEKDLHEEEAGAKMSFLEHLEELRRRIIHIVLYIGVGFLVCWFFRERIYDFLAKPIISALPTGKLIFTKPTEPFTLYMKVSLLASVFLTAPLIIFEIWLFISPGLYKRERRYSLPFIISSLILFVGGSFFAYRFILPPAYKFLLDFGSRFEPLIKIDEYFDLTITIVLGFGLIFEMPVVVAFLALFGLVTPGFLWRNFKYAILIIAIVAAVISPTGDAFNMLIYMTPMVVLYAVSIGVAWMFKKRNRPT